MNRVTSVRNLRANLSKIPSKIPGPRAGGQDEARSLLRRIQDASPLTCEAFAVSVLGRDPRTVRRWLAGERPIPRVMVEWLRVYANRRRQNAGVLR